MAFQVCDPAIRKQLFVMICPLSLTKCRDRDHPWLGRQSVHEDNHANCLYITHLQILFRAMNIITIRQATQNDSDQIALLHALSWKETYRNILPDSYLDNNLEDERRKYWSAKMAGLSPGDFVLLALSVSGEAIGFIAVLDKPEKEFESFIDNLHVRKDLKGLGVGSKLMKAAAEKLSTAGKKSAYLWVLKGNDKAEGFYKAMGGQTADVSVAHFGDADVWQTRFVWTDLHELLK